MCDYVPDEEILAAECYHIMKERIAAASADEQVKAWKEAFDENFKVLAEYLNLSDLCCDLADDPSNQATINAIVQWVNNNCIKIGGNNESHLATVAPSGCPHLDDSPHPSDGCQGQSQRAAAEAAQ